MINRIKKLRNSFGRQIYLLLFYPLVLIVVMPFILIQTLLNTLVIRFGQWRHYLSYSSMGINFLFCRTIAINIDRHGIKGVSPHIGGGNFDLSKFYYNALLGYYIFSGLGLTSVLISMLIWSSTHLLWLNTSSFISILIVVILSIISTTFYTNGLVKQKYHALGWAFFSIGIYGILHNNLWLAVLGPLAVSFGSTSVAILALLPIFILGIVNHEILILSLTVFVVAIKLMSHFVVVVDGKDNLFSKIISIFSFIGFLPYQVKSIYKRQATKYSLYHYYVFITSILYIILLFRLHRYDIAFLFSLIPVVILLNKIFRLFDEQNLAFFTLSISTISAIEMNSIFVILAHWITINPPMLILDIPYMKLQDKGLIYPPILKPFNVENIISEIDKFLDINEGERVLFCFNRPPSYEKIFDGFRVLLEIPLYVATKRRFCIFPDWHMVAENVYENDIEFWGRKIDDINKNCQFFKADKIIYYTVDEDDIKELDKLEKSGYQKIAEFDWKEKYKIIGDASFFELGYPKWHLLKAPVFNIQQAR